MKRALNAIVAAIILVLSFAAPAAAGPLEDAAAAYARSDYATALRLFRPLAEQGNAQAQFNIGRMYQNGQGVAQNTAEAAKWWRKAADQGDATAQNELGFMYANGLGVQQNSAEAAKWWRKAADQGNAMAKDNLAVLYAHFPALADDAQIPASGKITPEMWPIIAAAQVFHAQFFDVGGVSPIIRVVDLDTATIVDKWSSPLAGDKYTVSRDPARRCVFDLRRDDKQLAEIDFNKLKDNVSVSYEGYSMAHIVIGALDGAVCTEGDEKVYFHGHHTNVGLCGVGSLVFLVNESIVAQTNQALRYIFDNVCLPVAVAPLVGVPDP
jgi:hypothetical protein